MRRDLSVSTVTTLLCDADGTLFPSEEPAFEASAGVVNDAMATLGLDQRFDGEQLRRWASGRSFRHILTDLASRDGVALSPAVLAHWVKVENEVVTSHLARRLHPDPDVADALRAIRLRMRLALVSSSALARLDACLRATGLSTAFPLAARFSAQDSLPTPTSKPDPAVYVEAGRRLGVQPWQGMALEDAVPGVASAVAAGFDVLGIVCFVPPTERGERAGELSAAGASHVLDTWADVAAVLTERWVRPA